MARHWALSDTFAVLAVFAFPQLAEHSALPKERVLQIYNGLDPRRVKKTSTFRRKEFVKLRWEGVLAVTTTKLVSRENVNDI